MNWTRIRPKLDHDCFQAKSRFVYLRYPSGWSRENEKRKRLTNSNHAHLPSTCALAVRSSNRTFPSLTPSLNSRTLCMPISCRECCSPTCRYGKNALTPPPVLHIARHALRDLDRTRLGKISYHGLSQCLPVFHQENRYLK
jgi:hypothetical protein